MDKIQAKRNNRGDAVEDLQEEFSKVKNMQIPKTRTVILKYKSCCGCGCDYYAIKRRVSYDSPLKDGDSIKGYSGSDEFLGDWKNHGKSSL